MKNDSILPSDSDSYIASLEAQIKRLQEINTTIQQQLDWFRRQVFGPKSEQTHALFPHSLNGVQPELPLSYKESTQQVETCLQPDKVTVPEYTPRNQSGKRKFPNNAGVSGLRFNDTVDIEEVFCPNEEIEGLSPDQYEIIGTEIVDKLCQRKTSFFVKRFKRDKIKLIETKKILIAPAPPSVLPGSFLDVSFLAGMVVDKILFHLPLYRTHQRLKDGGIHIARSTLTNSFHAVGDLLQPVCHAQMESILAGRLITMDETPVKIGIKRNEHKMNQGYFWGVYGDKDEIVFLSYESRKHEVVGQILEGKFSGVLLSDDYAAYKNYAEKVDAIIQALCWSHSRRKFVEAKLIEPTKTQHVLALIGKLYKVEQQIRQHNLVGSEKLAYRASNSTQIVERIFAFLQQESAGCRVLPGSPFTKALLYTLDNEKGLREFLNNPDIPLDTNHIERANKSVAIGKKNWLFCTSEIGAEYVALFHSLLFTARLHDIDPYEYLVDVLMRIRTCPTEELYSLTPLGWKNARNERAQS